MTSFLYVPYVPYVALAGNPVLASFRREIWVLNTCRTDLRVEWLIYTDLEGVASFLVELVVSVQSSVALIGSVLPC